MKLSPFKKHYWKEEMFLAAGILLLATALGLIKHWNLVIVSWQGDLVYYLDAVRHERRAHQFKEVETVSLKEAYALWQKGETLFIDARPTWDYQELHIQGAANVPPESWATLASSPALTGLPKDRQILVYCSQESCDDALKLAVRLKALGFTRVLAFTGGFRAWDESGYPVATGP